MGERLTHDEWNAICSAAGEHTTDKACDNLKVTVERILTGRRLAARGAGDGLAGVGQQIKADNDQIKRDDFRAWVQAAGLTPDETVAVEAARWVDDAQKATAALRDRVSTLLPIECWVTRNADLFCSAFIGGEFGNGTWLEAMCCLPCRIRLALLDPDAQGADEGGGS